MQNSLYLNYYLNPAIAQKMFHIDKEHLFLDQTEGKKEEGLRGL